MNAKSEKTVSMTVRLDPKLKYGLEILARKQYRNLSSVVEMTLNELVNKEFDGYNLPYLHDIWDVYEQDKLVKLALIAPEILSYDEQKIWRVIEEFGDAWKNSSKSINSVNWQTIRENWKNIIDIANGKKEMSVLNKDTYDEFEDDIPF